MKSITRFDLYRLELLHGMDVLSMSRRDAETRASALTKFPQLGEAISLSFGSTIYLLTE